MQSGELERAVGGPAGADLAVCDMNHHPASVLPLLREVLPLLAPGGLVVLTLKFFGRGRDRCRRAWLLLHVCGGIWARWIS